jgi:hypothetical protein
MLKTINSILIYQCTLLYLSFLLLVFRYFEIRVACFTISNDCKHIFWIITLFAFPLQLFLSKPLPSAATSSKKPDAKERESLWRVIEGQTAQFYICTGRAKRGTWRRVRETESKNWNPHMHDAMPTRAYMYFVRCSACCLCSGRKRWVRDLSNTKTFVSSKNANVCDEHWGRESAEHFSAAALCDVIVRRRVFQHHHQECALPASTLAAGAAENHSSLM